MCCFKSARNGSTDNLTEWFAQPSNPLSQESVRVVDDGAKAVVLLLHRNDVAIHDLHLGDEGVYEFLNR